jgi:hypothetical protein
MLGVPWIASQTVAARWAYVIPVSALTTTVLKSTFKAPGRTEWFPVLLALLETLVFWAIAARIFSRVDIAVAVE